LESDWDGVLNDPGMEDVFVGVEREALIDTWLLEDEAK
jgi:hypothetical protein